ncbi:MAG: electron transfer flavoprotein subunit beta/FixA family protein [Candidatus Korarchaeum sp.]|nr:electron transfer flavoprotein subunit beta/FixA family protein [Candidatus Korarchaeum sp.]MDW8035039.1 electron transfer flavoprotein subunit beta/FixA family protein [Candidatus Korarchaeum sp.]
MDIAVLVKQSLDVQQLVVDGRSGKIYLDEAPTKAGDIEINATEEAIRIKEKIGGKAVAIMLACWGTSGRRIKEAREALTRLLAMGLDEAVLLLGDQSMDTYAAAKVIAEEVRAGNYQLVLTGEGSEDNFSGVIPGRVAAELGWPYLAYATAIEVSEEELKVTRSFEDYDEVISLKLPAIISVTQEINQPRIPTVLHIMKATKKPITQKEVTGIEPKVKIRELRALKVERRREIIEGDLEESIEKLLGALKSEGLIEVRL